MGELHELTVRRLRELLLRAEVSPVELTKHYLDRIARLDPGLGALVEVTADAALVRARSLAASGPDGSALWGLPFADKDLVARAGVPTRYGSRAFADFVPQVSDPFALLLDDLGAISLGKTNTSEFGLAGYTETRIAPPARDPWRTEAGAGGSSGGAAAAVAAGLLPFAAASDGGGSIRIPSATVGVVGLKPSRGRLPVGSGLDSIAGIVVHGAITRTVADAALLLDALAGGAEYRFATRAPGGGRFEDAALAASGRYRVGATTVSPWDDDADIVLDAEQLTAFERAAALLTALGHDVADAAWQPRGYARLFTTIWRASASRLRADLRLVEPLTAWLARAGQALDAAQLLEALADAAAFERMTIETFAPYDAVLTPALALPPRPVGWFDAEDGTRNFVQQVQYAPYSSFVNVAGLPAIVLPVATDADGHPVSVQLVGRPGGEAALLSIAAQLEQAAGMVDRHPPIW